MWPFASAAKRQVARRDYELRAVAFAQAIAESVENRGLGDAVGGIVAIGLAVQEACAGIWGRAFASASISGSRASGILGPSTLELIGREFIQTGQSCFILEVDDAGQLFAGVASSWEVNGRGVDPRAWRYRLDVLGPSGNRTKRSPSSSVLHFMLNRDPAQPWQGQSPITRSKLSRDLAAALETRLGEELAGVVGNLLSIPRDPGKRVDKDGNAVDALAEVKRTIAGLKGKTAIVETTQAGWGEGRLAAPSQDWKPQRLGANPPQTLVDLRDHMTNALANAAGVPPSLLGAQIDGTAQRESWRRFLHGTIAPAGLVVAEELTNKLEQESRLDFDGLFASDLSGRARAFQSMVVAGMEVSKAAALAGLMGSD